MDEVECAIRIRECNEIFDALVKHEDGSLMRDDLEWLRRLRLTELGESATAKEQL